MSKSESLDGVILGLTEYVTQQAEYLNFLSEAKLFKEATD